MFKIPIIGRVVATLLTLPILISCVVTPAPPGPVQDKNGQTIQREYLAHPTDGSRIEFFWTKPKMPGRWPVILLVHGSTGWMTGGTFVDTGTLGNISAKWKPHHIAASISQPGFGNSGGYRDYGGSSSQDAILAVIKRLREFPFVDPERVAVLGLSKGAISSAMVAARDPRLWAVVLGAGAYNPKRLAVDLVDKPNTSYWKEAGSSDAAFQARSAYDHAKEIKAAVLLVHGEVDTTVPKAQSIQFDKRLREVGATVETVILKDQGHMISAGVFKYGYKFLRKHVWREISGESRFLTKDQIRKYLIGNTAIFESNKGRKFSVYFAADSRVLLKGERSRRVSVKRWFFRDGGILCRTVTQNNREHCTKLRIIDDPRTIVFANGRSRYSAAILGGKRLLD